MLPGPPQDSNQDPKMSECSILPLWGQKQNHTAQWLPGSEQQPMGPGGGGRTARVHARPHLCLPAWRVGLRPRLAVASPSFDLGPSKVHS